MTISAFLRRQLVKFERREMWLAIWREVGTSWGSSRPIHDPMIPDRLMNHKSTTLQRETSKCSFGKVRWWLSVKPPCLVRPHFLSWCNNWYWMGLFSFSHTTLSPGNSNINKQALYIHANVFLFSLFPLRLRSEWNGGQPSSRVETNLW